MRFPDSPDRWRTALATLGQTQPWTIDVEAMAVDHPWTDVWADDGDLVFQVANHAVASGLELAQALRDVVSGAAAVAEERDRLTAWLQHLAARCACSDPPDPPDAPPGLYPYLHHTGDAARALDPGVWPPCHAAPARRPRPGCF